MMFAMSIFHIDNIIHINNIVKRKIKEKIAIHPLTKVRGFLAGGLVTFGPIAQLVEQRTHNPQVAGSSLAGPTEINC